MKISFRHHSYKETLTTLTKCIFIRIITATVVHHLQMAILVYPTFKIREEVFDWQNKNKISFKIIEIFSRQKKGK